MRNSAARDMTVGPPMRLILEFSIPLLFGYLFQQFYNIIDTVIVGRTLGINSLAAVGATGSVCFLTIGFCMGACIGFAIPISQRFGAKDYKALREYSANSIWLSIILSALITAVTVYFCRDILVLMKTPEEIIGESYEYLIIIFAGIPTVFLYNMAAGMIRALGDSRAPVVFLVISSIINILLDFVFIMAFNMGVSGAALATVISQGLSGIGCVVYIIKKFELLHIKKDEWAFNGHKAGVLCGMGIPMGLQYSITAIGAVVLQEATNTLGMAAVASVTAGSRLSNIMGCPYEALGSTMATYGGQNVGAGKLERLDKGLKECLKLGIGYYIIIFGITLIFGKYMALLFIDSNDAAILKNVQEFLYYNIGAYFLLAIVNIVRFLIQGMGFSKFAIIAGILEMAARVLTGIVLVPAIGYTGVCLGNAAAWVFADIFLIPAYFIVKRKLKREYMKE